jgi:hypothetical protein
LSKRNNKASRRVSAGSFGGGMNSPDRRKLRDLITDTPTAKETRKAIKAFHEGPPLICAIMGAAVIEGDLERLLRPKFKRNDHQTWMRLVGEYGPLGSFGAKIIAGHAFGLYDDITLRNLNKIRDIRNVFAHSKKPLTFNEQEIIKHLNTISMPSNQRSKRFKNLQLARLALKDNDPQTCFICLGACVIIDMQLIEQRRMKQQRYTTLRKLGKTMRRFVDMATANSVAVPEYIYQLLPRLPRK